MSPSLEMLPGSDDDEMDLAQVREVKEAAKPAGTRCRMGGRKGGMKARRAEVRGSLTLSSELVDRVLGDVTELDLLPIVMQCIGAYDLELLLDKCTKVCKVWRRAIRGMETPEKRLRDVWNKRVVSKYPSTSERIIEAETDAFWITDVRILNGYKLGNVPRTWNILMSKGGWTAREARRKRSYRINVDGRWWTPPPSTWVRTKHCFTYELPRRRLEEMFAARDTDDVEPWRGIVDELSEDYDHKKGRLHGSNVIVLEGKTKDGTRTRTWYVEFETEEDSNVHPILLRIPSAVCGIGWLRDHIVRGDTHPHMHGADNAPLDPKQSRWELFYDLRDNRVGTNDSLK